MVEQSGIALAVHIIRSHFGDFVAKVCECLLRKGTLSLSEIVRFTELGSKKVVVNCLLVLIQHNCVQAYSILREGGFGVAPKYIVQYNVIFENILHRLWFSKFLEIVKEDFSTDSEEYEECVEIVMSLLQHGRLTLEQIMFKAKDDNQKNNKDFTAQNQDALREKFASLADVHRRYIERCPLAEPFVQPLDMNPASRKRKFSLTEEITEGQRAIADATRSDKERFFDKEIFMNTNTSVDSDAKPSKKRRSLKSKEKIEEPEVNTATTITNEKESLWRVNFEEFTRRLSHKACVAKVKQRFDDGAATVLDAILLSTRYADKRVKINKTVPLSLKAIMDEVHNSNEGRTMTVEHIKAALGQLGCFSSGGDDEPYTVDLKKIIETAQIEELESVVLKKYTKEASIIFRFLADKKSLLTTKEIASTALVDEAKVLKILYNLWSDEFLNMEKTPTSAYASVLSWGVNTHFVRTRLLDNMYHSALNLILRIAYENEQGHELLALPREKLQEGEALKKYKRLAKIMNCLQSALMKLVETLMLFLLF